ncbi:MAG: (Fe-S)-binding protein [Pseudomonadota bacterium]
MISDPLLREADRCVKCGLCLPHCPTYLKLSNEADSPRGRISLIQAFITEDLSLTSSLQHHLDRCLGCRACEKACPSGVSFGKLIDGARSRIRRTDQQSPAHLKPWLLKALSDRNQLKKYTRALPLLRRSHLLAVGKKLAPANQKQPLKIAAVLPDHFVEPGLFPANRPSGKSLQLFLGCVSSIADQPAINAAIQLLTKLGYAVEIPRNQACCGALHRHNGLPAEADRLCEINSKLIKTSRAEALITLATACHLELVEQKVSSLPIATITEFLFNLLMDASTTAEFEPLAAKVAVHTPCSTTVEQTPRLLSVIPQLEISELPDNNLCCGAAGSFLLTQPDLANEFGQDKLTHLRSTMPDILVTTNTGCAIQFRMQIQQAKLDIEVLHPVELINRQLIHYGFQT